MQGWLLLHNQLSSFNSIIVQMSEKRVHQIESKNEWLLLSVAFMAKLELVLVLRILTGKKYRQIKLQRLEKVRIWAFGVLVYKSIIYNGS